MFLTGRGALIFQAIISFVVTLFCLYFTFKLNTADTDFLFRRFELLGLSFNLEPIGIIFLNMVSALWFLTSLYSVGYMKINENRLTIFMIGSVISAFLLAIAGSLVTTFLFYELLTLFTFPLIMSQGIVKELQAARKYLVTLMGLSMVLFLPAIAIIYANSGSADFSVGGMINRDSMTHGVAIISFILFLYGVAKTAIMPVHAWLPSAMVAPVPVSALLHAVVVVKAGLFVILKLCVYTYGIDYLSEVFGNIFHSNLVVILCGFSIVLSVIIASYQDNIKKLLAYSTINHISICLLSACLFSISGIKAAIVHMIGHAVSKLSLFLATGILEFKYGRTDIAILNGLSQRSKALALLFTIAILSMIGIPPLAGFVGKAYIFYASMGDNHDYIALFILSISILISAGYFMNLIYKIYNTSSFPLREEDDCEVMLFATTLGCLGVLLYVFSFPFLIEFLEKIAFSK